MSAVGNYVAKYCLKPAQFKSDIEKRLDRFIKAGVIPKTFYLMSKGIGMNYIDRMKRYHKPFIRDPCERIKVVCDRAFYHDGTFKYKLPRYYRDRLYRRLFPCDSNVWNPKLKQYEKKIVYRYMSKNPLALQMQTEIRNRIHSDYVRRFAELSAKYPSKSSTEIDMQLIFSDTSVKKARFHSTFSKMSRFYNYNRFKSSKF